VKFRTIAIVLDLSYRRPARNGKSNLWCGQQALIEFCQSLEEGDRVFLDGKVCQSSGEATAAVANYKNSNTRAEVKIKECIDFLSSSEENDELTLLVVTDTKPSAYLDVKAVRPIRGYLWAVGGLGDFVTTMEINCSSVQDITELQSETLLDCFSWVNKDERLEDTDLGCSPLLI
jgi:hypothetical protein